MKVPYGRVAPATGTYKLTARVASEAEEASTITVTDSKGKDLDVKKVPMSNAPIALMVHATDKFEARLYDMKGNLVATRHGAGNTLVEFGNDGNIAQGNYIAVVIKGSHQKVLRVRAGF